MARPSFRLALVPDDTALPKLTPIEISELASDIVALVKVCSLAVRDSHDGLYGKTVDHLPAINRALDLAGVLGDELNSHLSEIK